MPPWCPCRSPRRPSTHRTNPDRHGTLGPGGPPVRAFTSGLKAGALARTSVAACRHHLLPGRGVEERGQGGGGLKPLRTVSHYFATSQSPGPSLAEQAARRGRHVRKPRPKARAPLRAPGIRIVFGTPRKRS